MTKLGTDFELLVRAIYDEILSQSDVKNITVQHDVKKAGKSNQMHQIDVYWEFEVGGVTHRVAVECKDYKKKVSIGQLRNFFGVIEDIGNITGIFVTTIGYQSGAIGYAKEKGIQLKIVEEPKLERIDTFTTIFHIVNLVNLEIQPELDMDWLIDCAGVEEGSEIRIEAPNNKMEIMDVEGVVIDTFYDLERKLPQPINNQVGLTYTYKFKNAYLTWPDSPYPGLKLNEVTYKYDVTVATVSSVNKFKVMAEKLLRDVILDTCFFYNKKVTPVYKNNK